MSSFLTPEGLLLGAFEYGVYSAISRLITVAFLSDLAIRFVYARRIGIYLVADLSSKAGFRIFSANLLHKSNARWVARLQVVALFALAFLVTRGLDIIASTYSSAMQAGRSQRIAFVRTADTSPGARPAVRSATIQRPYNRSDVYHAIHGLVKGAIDVQQPLWPRTIGSLSDAEVAALVLSNDSSMCTAANLDPPPTALPEGSVNATTAIIDRIEPLRTRAKSLFGEDVELIDLRFSGTGPSNNAVNRWPGASLGS
ncbi:hypothetical protein BCR44DRAFT_51789 [Catenaria anguillulae PL171]|uniref:Uncharacterized protein n=1 Tax=Catenaria anguillulae PL171 TaxID=765915 RepID=A0A1Y2H612_9FUNG|nr:hypothetical protein BCR44DRAFT_51789 [Catenaria anguillulae PL171]